jgi:5'-3' exonuclease
MIGLRLVKPDQSGLLRWNSDGLKYIVECWAYTEKEDFQDAFKRKYTARTAPPRTPAEKCMLPVQNLPLEIAEERTMWNRETGLLYSDWKEQYVAEKRLFPVAANERCSEYCRGLQWVLDYYTGQRPVDQEWMYPWTYPPLWSELEAFLETYPLCQPPAPQGHTIQPQEQLTLVLPLESWSLVRNPVLKAVPENAPHFWPLLTTFHTLGKRFMWECPPNIPIMTYRRLLALVKRTVAQGV